MEGLISTMHFSIHFTQVHNPDSSKSHLAAVPDDVSLPLLKSSQPPWLRIENAPHNPGKQKHIISVRNGQRQHVLNKWASHSPLQLTQFTQSSKCQWTIGCYKLEIIISKVSETLPYLRASQLVVQVSWPPRMLCCPSTLSPTTEWQVTVNRRKQNLYKPPPARTNRKITWVTTECGRPLC